MKEDHDDDRNKEQALIETFYYCENVVDRSSAVENDNNAMFQSCVILLPCGHLCACAQCCYDLSQCPLCRADILTRVNI